VLNAVIGSKVSGTDGFEWVTVSRSLTSRRVVHTERGRCSGSQIRVDDPVIFD
jgi:hypothetical protein